MTTVFVFSVVIGTKCFIIFVGNALEQVLIECQK